MGRPLSSRIDLSQFDVHKAGEELRVSWDWPRGRAWLPGAAAAAFCLVFPAAIAAEDGWKPALVVAAVAALPSAPLIYLAAAFALNRTTLRVSGGVLSVEHGPVPWRSPPPVDASDVRAVRVDARQRDVREQVVRTYHLVAVDAGGSERQLFQSLESDHAEVARRMLEVHLGLGAE